MSLLSDVNLGAVKFSIDGRNINLSFLDMYDLQPLIDLQCCGVCMLNMQNTFEDDEGFACYIGEVNCIVVERKHLKDWLQEHNYSFSGNTGLYLPGNGDLKWLSLDSGEIVIDILCQDVVSINRKV